MLDDSHDLVRLIKDDDEIEIEIEMFMFDADEFDSILDTLDFELLEDLASVHDRFDIDELYTLEIFLEGGDDVGYTDQDLDVRFFIHGGDGDTSPIESWIIGAGTKRFERINTIGESVAFDAEADRRTRLSRASGPAKSCQKCGRIFVFDEPAQPAHMEKLP